MAVVNSFAKFYGATYPAEGDVRQGSPTYGDAIDIRNGTLVVSGDTPNYPPESAVLEGTIYGTDGAEEFSGNVHLPPIDKVEDQYTFGPNRVLIGTLQATGEVPRIEDVRAGVPVGESVGVLELPAPSLVVEPTGYGAFGTEFVGTFNCGQSPTPGMCLVTLRVIDQRGQPVPNASVFAKIKERVDFASSALVADQDYVAKTDENGIAQFELIRSSEFTDGTGVYEINVRTAYSNQTFDYEAPDAASDVITAPL